MFAFAIPSLVQTHTTSFVHGTCAAPACHRIRAQPQKSTVATNWKASETSPSAREADPVTQSPLGTPQVICYGEILHDLLSHSPDADAKDLSQWEPFTGGAPANVSACLAALGTPVAFVGNVGDDNTGEQCIDVLRSRNVDVSGMSVLPSTSTRRIFVRRTDGERRFEGFDGENGEFADAVKVDLDATPGVLFYASRAFVTGTLGLAFPGSASSIDEALKMAQMCKLFVIIDVNWRDTIWSHVPVDEARSRILSVLKSADLVKASVEDIQFLLGQHMASQALDDPFAICKAIGAGKRGIIVSGGEEGVAYAFRENGSNVCNVKGRIKAITPPNGVVDTTGAGDALLAAFLSELLNSGGPAVLSDSAAVKSIVTFAVKVASVVVSGAGAMDPLKSREQVLAVMGSS